MNLLLLDLLITKATATSLLQRPGLVEHYLVLNGRQLNAAVAAGRTAPAPSGLYLVSVGYFVAGAPDGCAGLPATIKPAS